MVPQRVKCSDVPDCDVESAQRRRNQVALFTARGIASALASGDITCLSEDIAMKTYMTVGLSILAGAALAASVMQTLHAQAKPPAYVIEQISVKDPAAFFKEYVPAGMQAIQGGGGRVVVDAQKPVAFTGATPLGVVAVIQFDNMDQARAYWDSQARKNAFDIGEKYATFTLYAVQGH
jgi:uncharacterized protein (DUF1330 family)